MRRFNTRSLSDLLRCLCVTRSCCSGSFRGVLLSEKNLFCVVKIIKIDLRVLVFLSLYHSSEIGQPVKTYFILKHVKVCQERRLIKTS